MFIYRKVILKDLFCIANKQETLCVYCTMWYTFVKSSIELDDCLINFYILITFWYNSADEDGSKLNICYTSFLVGGRWSKRTVWRECIWGDPPKEKCRHEEVWQAQGSSWPRATTHGQDMNNDKIDIIYQLFLLVLLLIL